MNVTLMDWINYFHRNIVGFQSRWLGHRALKNPLDAWIYQEILYEVRPDVIVEIGNKSGGGALFLAGICDALKHGVVLALDITRDRMTAKHRRIVELTGDAADPRIIREVHRRCKGKRTLVIHDADHTKDAVLRDLRNYSDLVRHPSYLIVEDTTDGLPGFMGRRRGNSNSPLQAIDVFLRENRRFCIDKSRERYLLTANFNGYLKCLTREKY
ncbi:MAG: hypothetical protein A3G34_14075 [Candidatus Lindowbacteria bacterium RIFCSPLOWO2_12_FULL_62_27]|nr:MAG: hypothetical protein A3I06_00540 [Candidatus Lindowbacteria bacterium RIFCSPLOWO2_02_FULL_62_12]OGH62800.1 MAG: hypothetical protein A3G34_14075 [Candidatus Lindowbacteria bacterium RIFCSPLOWO2_12_FULL_62_27]